MTTADTSLNACIEALRCLRQVPPPSSSSAASRHSLVPLTILQRHLPLLPNRSARASAALVLHAASAFVRSSDASIASTAIDVLRRCIRTAQPLPLSFWPGALGALASACRCPTHSEIMHEDALTGLDDIISVIREDKEAVAALRSKEFAKSLAHISAVLMDVAAAEAQRKLRSKALQALTQLVQAAGSEALRPIVPGLVSGIARVCVEDYKSGTAVLSSALDALSALLVLAFPLRPDDASHAGDRLHEIVNIAPNHAKEQPAESEDEGIKIASKMVQTVVRRRSQLCVDPSIGVCLALVRLAQSVLGSTCMLSDARTSLVDMLMGLVQSEREDVSKAAQLALRSAGVDTELQADAIATKMQELGPAPTVEALRGILGYVRAMKPRQLVLAFPKVKPVLLSLLQVQISSVQALETSDHPSQPLVATPDEQEKSASLNIAEADSAMFYAIRLDGLNEQSSSVLFSICRAFGQGIGLDVAAATIPSLLQIKLSSQRSEAVLLSNLMVEGLASVKPDVGDHQRYSVLESIFDAYMDDSDDIEDHNMSFVEATDDDEVQEKVSTLVVSQRNEMRQALLLRGVASVAKAMGTSFDSQLKYVIFMLLNKLASPSPLVSQNALAALGHCGRACGFGSFRDMVMANTDYLIDAISFKLRLPEQDDPMAVAPAMLEALLDRTGSGHDLVPLLDDTVELVLTALDERRSETHVHAYLRALLSVIRALSFLDADKNLAPNRTITNDDLTDSSSDFIPADNESKLVSVDSASQTLSFEPADIATRLRKSIAELVKAKEADAEFEHRCDEFRLGSGFEEGGDDELHENEDENQPDVETQAPIDDDAPISPSHQTIVQILDRARHYLESPFPRRRHLVLEIATEGLDALQTNERALLPAVAKMWSPLLPRFVDTHPAIASKALEAAELMIRLCPQFVRRRLSDELWPALRPILCRESIVRRPHNLISESDTKLQLRALQFLCACLAFPASGRALELASSFADTCWHYLASDDFRLRNATLSLFERFLEIAPDMCWWKLIRLYSSGSKSSPKRYTVAPPSCLPVQNIRGLGVAEKVIAARCIPALEALLDRFDRASEPTFDNYLS